MTTFRQFERGVVRTLRALDREAQIRNRQRMADAKAAARMASLEAASEAAASYADFVANLVEAHRMPFEPRDWSRSGASHEAEPIPSSDRERAATGLRDAYRPWAISRLIGRADRRRAKLDRGVAVAKMEDERIHLEHLETVRARNAEIEFAKAVVALDPQSVMEVVNDLSGAGRLPIALQALAIEFPGEGRLTALVDGIDVDDMPSESVNLLQSGKASFKPLSAARRYEMHRDAMCSLAARTAIELLQALPAASIDVIVHCKLLNRGTGEFTRQPVLSLKASAQAMSSVNLARTDAPFLVEHLGGLFRWTKRDGLSSLREA